MNTLTSKFALSTDNISIFSVEHETYKMLTYRVHLYVFLNFNSWSVVIPSNFTTLEEGITLLDTFKLKQSFLFVTRTINWNFPRLAWRELILNQSVTLLRLKKWRSKFLSPRKRVSSYAKLHTFLTFLWRGINHW